MASSDSTPEARDFSELFRDHAAFVWRVLRRFGVHDADLEDVCQEVFLVVHRRLHEFEGRSSLSTWIYEIARRSALAHLRLRPQRREQGPDALNTMLDAAPAADQALAQRAALDWLELSLLELDEDKREAFILYELEELSLADVAAAVGAPINTVHYRIQTARATLLKRERAQQLVEDARAAAQPILASRPGHGLGRFGERKVLR
jgi:RNA polymerase sigma-70 factor (ECF subfamily)